METLTAAVECQPPGLCWVNCLSRGVELPGRCVRYPSHSAADQGYKISQTLWPRLSQPSSSSQLLYSRLSRPPGQSHRTVHLPIWLSGAGTWIAAPSLNANSSPTPVFNPLIHQYYSAYSGGASFVESGAKSARSAVRRPVSLMKHPESNLRLSHKRRHKRSRVPLWVHAKWIWHTFIHLTALFVTSDHSTE